VLAAGCCLPTGARRREFDRSSYSLTSKRKERRTPNRHLLEGDPLVEVTEGKKKAPAAAAGRALEIEPRGRGRAGLSPDDLVDERR